ncbi:unnamed protein product [Agarophyton chilense]
MEASFTRPRRRTHGEERRIARAWQATVEHTDTWYRDSERNAAWTQAHVMKLGFSASASQTSFAQREFAWTRRTCSSRRRQSSVTVCASDRRVSLSHLEKSGVLTIVERRHDYDTNGVEPKGYVEPKKIFIVGVSHLSEGENSSAAVVGAVIEAVQPEAVVVELCRSRTALLYDEENSASPESGGDKSTQVRSKQTAGWFRAPLAALLAASGGGGGGGGGSKKVGAEWVAARKAAVKCGAQVVLGDRPLHCTVRRIWGALSLREKYLLVVMVLRGLLQAPKVEMIEDEGLRKTIESGVAQEGVLKKYTGLLQVTLPNIVRPLIYERDLYLAWSLKRCEAVKGKECVVGVIGMGHVEGVVRSLREDDELRRQGGGALLRFSDLVR